MAFHLCTLEVWRETGAGGGGGGGRGLRKREGRRKEGPAAISSNFRLHRLPSRLSGTDAFWVSSAAAAAISAGVFVRVWTVWLVGSHLLFFVALFLSFFVCFCCCLVCSGVSFVVGLFSALPGCCFLSFFPVWVWFCFLLSSVCAGYFSVR